MPKLTFSLDADTVASLRKAAQRTRKPQSLIVREAIAHYASREDLLAPADRDRLLKVVRKLRARPQERSLKAVESELAGIRRSRRRGWSRPER